MSDLPVSYTSAGPPSDAGRAKSKARSQLPLRYLGSQLICLGSLIEDVAVIPMSARSSFGDQASG